ncbi:MAG: class I SAM-dependent methyltransferase [Pseudomonadota bacterium]
MKKITQCRACRSRSLTPALDFSAPAGKKNRGLGEYVLCDPSRDARACGLLQSAYKDGPVLAGGPATPSATTRNEYRAIATEALEMISGRDCAALDIGCGDGALLSHYPRWVERYGVDEDDAIEDVGQWAHVAKDAFSPERLRGAFGVERFDIVTAISKLEYSDDPAALLKGAKDLLTDDGVIVVETLYSPLVLTRNCLEALQIGVRCFFSLGVLEGLAREAQLKIVKGGLTSKDGGSIRLFLTHIDNNDFDFDPWLERLARLWDEENALALRALQPYQTFASRADEVRSAFRDALDEIFAKSQTAHLLGADAHAEALLKIAGTSAKAISAAVDNAAAREATDFGARRIPLISEAECRAAEPDFLVAPARGKREVLERWREPIFLGARVLFATPGLHIVSASNYAAEYGKAVASGDGPAGVETLRNILAAAGAPRLVVENPSKVQAG